ncbi:ABC transporter ATP-binding protein, partial [Halobacteriales archaeon QS_3_64_16]
MIRAESVEKYFGGELGVWETITGAEATPVRAVDDVSLSVEQGEIVGIAGESGC